MKLGVTPGSYPPAGARFANISFGIDQERLDGWVKFVTEKSRRLDVPHTVVGGAQGTSGPPKNSMRLHLLTAH